MKQKTIKRILAVVLSAAVILPGIMANTIQTSAAEAGNGEPVSAEGVLPLAAEASQSRSGWDITPDNLVNGSGLSKKNSLDATHSNGNYAQGMWQTEDNAGSSVWVKFDTGRVQELANLYIWNHNQYDGTDQFLKRGFHFVNIEYSSDGESWTPLDEQLDVGYHRELHMATGSVREPVSDTVALGVDARYVRIAANPDPRLGTFDGGGCYGLSEVMITHYMGETDIAKENLANALAQTQKLSDFDFAAEKWVQLQAAVRAAGEMLENENATEQEIAQTEENLDAAAADTGIPSGVSASLEKKIREAQELKREEYTAESWQDAKDEIAQALGAARDAALLGVNDTSNAGKADDALKKLTRAIAKLRGLPRERMEMYRELVNQRFGMFLHYNMSTYTNNGQNPKYDFALEDWGPAMADPEDFDPTSLDTDQWADAAVSAQMEFSCMTSKHHDGFDIWPSQVNDHNISKGNQPGLDVVEEYLTSFRSRGIQAGLYFSIMDLHLEAVEKPNFSGTNDQIRKEIYTKNRDVILGQIRELMTNYGDIPFLILDGWNADWGSDLGSPLYTELPYRDVEELVHSLQPNCIVINISCEVNDTHTDLTIFENGAGQTIPSWFDKPGMACHNLQGQWFWNTNNPTQQLQSVDWVLNQMCYPQNRKGCAFILNAAPNPEGRMDRNVLDRLGEIGDAYEKLPDLQEIPSSWYKDYDTAGNLAWKKTISQSSVSGRSYGERAADGILNGSDSRQSVSATKTESNPWWQVDLGGNKELGEITIWNCEGEAKKNLTNFWIFASDQELTGTLKELKDNERITKVHVTDTPGRSLKVALNTTARYVRIQLEGYKSLNLAEVVLSEHGEDSAKDIYKVTSLGERRVETGTGIEELNLPSSVEVTLTDGSTCRAGVKWDNGVPEYNSSGKGTYRFTGTLTDLPGNVTNLRDLKAILLVTFEEIRLESVDAPGEVQAGDRIVLKGHFGKTPGKVVLTGPGQAVKVGKDSPYLITWEAQQIVLLVPGGVSTGSIYVETADGTQTDKSFVITTFEEGVTEDLTGDTQPPVTKAEVTGEQSKDGAYINQAEIRLTAEDEGTGPAGISWQLNSGGIREYESPIVISKEGEFTLTYYAYDRAGNRERKNELRGTVVQGKLLFEDSFDEYGPGKLSDTAEKGYQLTHPDQFLIAKDGDREGNVLKIQGKQNAAVRLTKQDSWDGTIMTLDFKYQDELNGIEGLYVSNYYQSFSPDNMHAYPIIPGYGGILLQQNVNGSATETARLENDRAGLRPGSWYHLKAYTSGSRMALKVWPEGSAEPEAWMAEGSVSGLKNGGGLHLGFSTGGNEANYAMYDNVKVIGFQEADPVRPADKTELRRETDKMKAIDLSLYQPDSTTRLKNALAAAEKLLEDEGLTAADQAKIQEAVEELRAGYRELKEIQEPDTEPDREPDKVVSYQVTFTNYDGTVLSEQKVEKNASAKAPSVPERFGYTFAGWSSAYGNVTQNLVVTAQFKANTYYISFQKNGGKGSMGAQSLTYDRESRVKANSFRRPGYVFKGWNTQKNGKGTAYVDKKAVKNLTHVQGKTIYLYAQWKKVKKPGRVRAFTAKSKKARVCSVTIANVRTAGGYQIQYAQNKSFKKARSVYTAGQSGKRTVKALKGLKRKKTYYLRVRAYARDSAGKRYYAPKFSGVKKVKIR